MSLEEAAEYALAREAEPVASPAPEKPAAELTPISLTPRENEVMFLVAREMSNRQIAAALTLSEHTVATHVRNVLKKLGLHSRNQVAAWLREHQPLP